MNFFNLWEEINIIIIRKFNLCRVFSLVIFRNKDY